MKKSKMVSGLIILLSSDYCSKHGLIHIYPTWFIVLDEDDAEVGLGSSQMTFQPIILPALVYALSSIH